MREIVSSLIFQMIGTPYRWGGDDTVGGIDCSGMIIEPLKSVGILPRKGDWPAEGLRQYFSDCMVHFPYEGCLVFYGKNNHATHVEYCYNRELAIGASGGGRSTNYDSEFINQVKDFLKAKGLQSGASLKIANILGSEDAKLIAVKQNALVKMRPIKSRKYILGYVDPFMK